ncbi:MAG TPA: S4 domain-containing protein, partial [Solirubrobacteraceae bacterium]|nr:S4 domain-containing protein [Solirubrobacteraceae bacterium]
MARLRLDALLAQRGLFASRSRAAASVMAGEVRVGSERRRVDKPGHLVATDVAVEVAEGPAYVSRGGL